MGECPLCEEEDRQLRRTIITILDGSTEDLVELLASYGLADNDWRLSAYPRWRNRVQAVLRAALVARWAEDERHA